MRNKVLSVVCILVLFCTNLFAQGTNKKRYVELRIAVIILANFEMERLPPSEKSPAGLSVKEIDRIKSELNEAVLFYWINSKLNLYLKLDYYIVNEYILTKDFLEENVPKHQKIIEIIKNEKGDISNYVGVVIMMAKRKWDWVNDVAVLTGTGGGLTYGADLRGYGFSWFEITPANAPSDNAWVFTHEFHHQLDTLMNLSKHPEYWSNHPSPKDKNTAKFGEHYDCNAYILRNWDKQKWFDLKFGTIKDSIDSDSDEIPDNEPDLPMDEKRFLSKPNSKDTDQDGLSDFEELISWNWVKKGCGEIMQDNFSPSDPKRKDSDMDGFIDSKDKFPALDMKEHIKKKEISFDDFKMDDIPNLCDLKFKDIIANIRVGWDTNALYILIKANFDDFEMKIQLDANDDGWFVGKDNYRIVIDAKVEEIKEMWILNCSDVNKDPAVDPSIIKIDKDIKMKKLKEQNRYAIAVKISKNDITGLALTEKESLGLSICFRKKGDTNWIAYYEPNAFCSFGLEK